MASVCVPSVMRSFIDDRPGESVVTMQEAILLARASVDIEIVPDSTDQVAVVTVPLSSAQLEQSRESFLTSPLNLSIFLIWILVSSLRKYSLIN